MLGRESSSVMMEDSFLQRERQTFLAALADVPKVAETRPLVTLGSRRPVRIRAALMIISDLHDDRARVELHIRRELLDELVQGAPNLAPLCLGHA